MTIRPPARIIYTYSGAANGTDPDAGPGKGRDQMAKVALDIHVLSVTDLERVRMALVSEVEDADVLPTIERGQQIADAIDAIDAEMARRAGVAPRGH